MDLQTQRPVLLILKEGSVGKIYKLKGLFFSHQGAGSEMLKALPLIYPGTAVVHVCSETGYVPQNNFQNSTFLIQKLEYMRKLIQPQI